MQVGTCHSDAQTKRLSLYIPVSKMDQLAGGVRRALQCCGQQPCMRFCSWRVWHRIKDDLPRKRSQKGFIFVDKLKKPFAKAKMMDSWKSATRLNESHGTLAQKWRDVTREARIPNSGTRLFGQVEVCGGAHLHQRRNSRDASKQTL